MGCGGGRLHFHAGSVTVVRVESRRKPETSLQEMETFLFLGSTPFWVSGKQQYSCPPRLAADGSAYGLEDMFGCRMTRGDSG